MQKPTCHPNRKQKGGNGLCESCYAKKRWRETPSLREAQKKRAAKWMTNNRSKWLVQIKNNHYKRSYGITLEDFQNRVLKQKGKCTICKKIKPLCVDHNHATGKVRELLCSTCNRALGYAQENPAILRAMEQYIKRHR